MLLFVGTPSLEARDARIRSKLLSSRLGAEERERAGDVAREFLDSRWDSVRFLTFAESESFANIVTDLAVCMAVWMDVWLGVWNIILPLLLYFVAVVPMLFYTIYLCVSLCYCLNMSISLLLESWGADPGSSGVRCS